MKVRKAKRVRQQLKEKSWLLVKISRKNH